MKVRRHHGGRARAGALLTEAVVALGILVAVMIPLAFTFQQETRTCRAHYYKAVAMEIVDGEVEALAAGEWRAFRPGKQSYAVRAAAATNLPPGDFLLTLDEARVRLEWIPRAGGAGGIVAREVKVR
ncbi:MAG TPA: hypothetical protein VFT34_14435 [Verrucomicrobiae bacterium]|nr:hypothetical protein [Verrucomicrobiae bacterium]